MDFLEEGNAIIEAKGNKLIQAVRANTRMRTWLIIACIFIVLATVALVATYSTIATRIEASVKDKYEKQIVALQNRVEDNEDKYTDSLEKQKESYEKKLTKAEEKHNSELEKQKESYEDKLAKAEAAYEKDLGKKDKELANQAEEIRLLEVKLKVQFNEIETQIQTVGKMSTIEYHYVYAGSHEDAKNFFGLKIAKSSFIAQWEGVVALGVDLSKVKLDVNETTKTITVKIPAAEIFYHDVDEDSFVVLDEKNNIFNPITVADVKDFDDQYEEKIIEKIKENRMLDNAYEAARLMIENMLKAVPQLAGQYTIQYSKN